MNFPAQIAESLALRYCLWGAGFARGLVTWLVHLRWPHQSFDDSIPVADAVDPKPRVRLIEKIQ